MGGLRSVLSASWSWITNTPHTLSKKTSLTAFISRWVWELLYLLKLDFKKEEWVQSCNNHVKEDDQLGGSKRGHEGYAVSGQQLKAWTLNFVSAMSGCPALKWHAPENQLSRLLPSEYLSIGLFLLLSSLLVAQSSKSLIVYHVCISLLIASSPLLYKKVFLISHRELTLWWSLPLISVALLWFPGLMFCCDSNQLVKVLYKLGDSIHTDLKHSTEFFYNHICLF